MPLALELFVATGVHCWKSVVASSTVARVVGPETFAANTPLLGVPERIFV